MSEKLPIDGLTEEERHKERLRMWRRRMRDLDKLRDEYIWHLEQRDNFLDVTVRQKERIDELEVENDALRKLVKVLLNRIIIVECDDCGESGSRLCDKCRVTEYKRELSELGIEVK